MLLAAVSADRMTANKARYLIFFQYCGTSYSGVVRVPETHTVLGVQNYLEMAAQKLCPVGKATFSISSRTDSRVHAICNSAHVDIERPPDKSPFSEDILVKALNFHLKPEPISPTVSNSKCRAVKDPDPSRIQKINSIIENSSMYGAKRIHIFNPSHVQEIQRFGYPNLCQSIRKAIRVSDDFHARFKAISRTYFYRVVTGCKFRSMPVFERDLCWAATERHLDIPRIQEAAQFFVGTHDFSGFRSINKDTPLQSPVKTLLQADITPSNSLLTNALDNSNLQFWDFTFKGKSFTYNQVRRMTSALVAVGLGHLTPQQIKLHLEDRRPPTFPGSIVAPPSGLFLKEVEYDEEVTDVKEISRHLMTLLPPFPSAPCLLYVIKTRRTHEHQCDWRIRQHCL